MTTTTAVSIRERLESPAFHNELAKLLPKHITPDRMARAFVTAIMRTPELAKCDQVSFFKAAMDLSAWGLEPDGRRAHLIPFRNTKRNTTEVQLIIDYKGLVELAFRSGVVSKIHADVIREGDLLDYSMGELRAHVPWFLRRDEDKPHQAGEIIAAYCVVTMAGGVTKCELLAKDEIESIRLRSRAGNVGPWKTDWCEMAKKGLALDTRVPTPDGWTTMGELRPGDIVFDMHGQQTSVMAVSERKQLPCFRLTLSNGESIICDDEHRWVASIGGRPISKANTYTVNELLKAKRSGKAVSIPVAGALETNYADLPVEPWILGYWLGNGHSHGASVTCHEDDADEIIDQIEAMTEYEVGAVRPDLRSSATTIGIKGGLKVALRECGVLGNKHVPPVYLRASFDQRLSLLRGLMDSDGCIEKTRGRAVFGSTNKQLSDAVYELVVSLGETCHRSHRLAKGYGKTVDFYSVEWTPSNCPVSIDRKSERFRGRTFRHYRSVSGIEPTSTVTTVCIAVDSPTRTYLVGDSMTPTHNTAFRRVSKWLPLSSEIRDAFERDDDRLEHRPTIQPRPARVVSDLAGITQELVASHGKTEPQSAPTPTDEDYDEFQATIEGLPDEAIAEVAEIARQRFDDADWIAFVDRLAAKRTS